MFLTQDWIQTRIGLLHSQVFKEFKMSEQNNSLLYKLVVAIKKKKKNTKQTNQQQQQNMGQLSLANRGQKVYLAAII